MVVDFEVQRAALVNILALLVYQEVAQSFVRIFPDIATDLAGGPTHPATNDAKRTADRRTAQDQKPGSGWTGVGAPAAACFSRPTAACAALRTTTVVFFSATCSNAACAFSPAIRSSASTALSCT